MIHKICSFTDNLPPVYDRILLRNHVLFTYAKKSNYGNTSLLPCTHTGASSPVRTPEPPPLYAHRSLLPCTHTGASSPVRTPEPPPLYAHRSLLPCTHTGASSPVRTPDIPRVTDPNTRY